MITLICTPFRTLGEGPHWEERTQSLLYVDMFRGHIHRYKPETNTEEILDLGGTNRNISIIIIITYFKYKGPVWNIE